MDHPAPRRYFRLQVNEDELTDEFYEFVVDPQPSRGERAVIQELHDVAPEMVDVLESMVMDGVEERTYVADYVHSVLNE